MVLTVETGALLTGSGIAITLFGKWLTSKLKETSESIINAERIRQLRIDHEDLKKRFEEYDKEHRIK